MFESISSFVSEFGYIAVFLGSLIEGESVILTASAFAYSGVLNIYKIMIVAFFGTWIADQCLYMVGRYYGTSFFEKFPSLKGSAERGFILLKKWDAGFIIACRFIYGVRITSCIVVGASGIPPSRFIPLNTLSALIWTIVSCTGGYLLGPLMISFFENFHKIQKYLFLGVGALFLLVVTFILLKKKKIL